MNIRNYLVVILALAVGVGLIMLIQGIGHQIYPPPKGVLKGDLKAIQIYIETAPIIALLIIPFSYLVGCTVAELVACRWTKGSKRSIYLVGVLLLVMVVINLFQISHPIWLAVANTVFIALPVPVVAYYSPRCREEIQEQE